MSVEAMVAVFRESRSSGVARLVALAIANEANSDGLLTAYRRSQAHLASAANTTSRSVQRSIEELARLGELDVLRVGNGRASSDYRLLLPSLIEGRRDVAPGTTRRRGRDDETSPLKAGRASSRDNPLSPVLSQTSFDDVWSRWPRKTGKGAAKTKWERAVARHGDVVAAGVERYLADPNLPEPQFVPMLATWLNQERWTDGPLPERTDGRRPTATERTMANLDELMGGGANGNGQRTQATDRGPQRGIPKRG